MKHARPDYDPIQDPRGLIPDDEPVFLIRGQDLFAITTLEHYAWQVEQFGGECPLVHQQIDRIREWQRTQRVKFPSGPDGSL